MNYIIDNHGMTLRDYFAAKAMQALLSSHQCYPMGANFEEPAIARRAYRMADAMLEQRK
ncbi:hypothetical protein [Cronobacter turicensis]|uniref:hypothetical protein n=1 Tax=Cronobacter turicensis TaxID=413502 RepID=UPI0024C2C7F3|nr:hypothetical protein [Cronobacter turicensis]MDK1227520.1 hypothetical protein [Cronobacter turicensis]